LNLIGIAASLPQITDAHFLFIHLCFNSLNAYIFWAFEIFLEKKNIEYITL